VTQNRQRSRDTFAVGVDEILGSPRTNVLSSPVLPFIAIKTGFSTGIEPRRALGASLSALAESLFGLPFALLAAWS